MYLVLSLVPVLTILAHGVSVCAWLEDDGVSVLTQVILEMDGCNPASPANI